jgi:cytoskeletal protein CcmA (bactofilin family)
MANTTNTISGNWNVNKPYYVDGNVMLHLTGGLMVSGSGFIQINPGGHLTLYVSGTTSKITGGGVINLSGLPSNFSYIGLSGNKNIDVGGGGTFYGTINAPQAAIKVSGNGDIYGAIIAASYTANGNGSFHYDGELAEGGDLYVISWKEL